MPRPLSVIDAVLLMDLALLLTSTAAHGLCCIRFFFSFRGLCKPKTNRTDHVSGEIAGTVSLLLADAAQQANSSTCCVESKPPSSASLIHAYTVFRPVRLELRPPSQSLPN